MHAFAWWYARLTPWWYARLRVGTYSLATDYIHACAWVHAVLRLITYTLARGYIQSCDWLHARLRVGTYSLATDYMQADGLMIYNLAVDDIHANAWWYARLAPWRYTTLRLVILIICLIANKKSIRKKRMLKKHYNTQRPKIWVQLQFIMKIIPFKINIFCF